MTSSTVEPSRWTILGLKGAIIGIDRKRRPWESAFATYCWSGNPGGRPKEIAEVKALARTHTTTAINPLVSIAKSKTATDAARVSACLR